MGFGLAIGAVLALCRRAVWLGGGGSSRGCSSRCRSGGRGSGLRCWGGRCRRGRCRRRRGCGLGGLRRLFGFCWRSSRCGRWRWRGCRWRGRRRWAGGEVALCVLTPGLGVDRSRERHNCKHQADRQNFTHDHSRNTDFSRVAAFVISINNIAILNNLGTAGPPDCQAQISRA